MSEVEKIFCRGFSAEDTETAVRKRLAIDNQSSSELGEIHRPVPGIFFSAGEETIMSAENWGLMIAQREAGQAHTMKIKVTPENFSHISGKIYNLIFDRSRSTNYDYEIVADFGKLKEQETVIDVWMLSHKDLIALDCMVGVGGPEVAFTYTPYDKLTRKYLTAEEIEAPMETRIFDIADKILEEIRQRNNSEPES